MRRIYIIFAAALAFVLFTGCDKTPPGGVPDSLGKLSGITYQINVYSFADSDGDGWGDLRGITQHLDYLDELGATALWLSPIQTAGSYHGYDILDYNAVNPQLGTEEDLQELINKARQRNIGIYLDYVLNHSGKGDWFNSAISSKDSPYRSYYVLSENPTEDVAAGKIDNYGGGLNPGMGSWHLASGGDLGYSGRLHFKLDWSKKTVTVTESKDAVQASNPSAKMWLWIDEPGKLVGLYETSTNVFEITIDVNTPWGFLVRSSSTSWGDGTKWGGDGGSVTFGTPFSLNNSTAADITFGGSSIWYFGSFDSSMPDLNYGPYYSADTSPAFKDLAASVDKWIGMGIAGLRLDAVMWIYQNRATANINFLKKWYDRCNTSWHHSGKQGDIFMVAETWADNAETMAPYYQGVPSNFNFYYWYTLKDRINKGRGSDFAQTVSYFRNLFRREREDFIDAIKLSNHDEDRAGEDLGRSKEKMKLAGAVLLTSPGKPFIYQGEELGYWGSKGKGDEYVRTPIKWNRGGAVSSAALGGKVDHSMLTPEISVEAQEADKNSILNVYKNFAKARNSYKSLAFGEIEAKTSSNNALAIWTMNYEGQTMLVTHNFSGDDIAVEAGEYNLTQLIVSNGTVKANKGSLSLGPYSSAVFLQQGRVF